tara:strand:+ start:14531 stop:17260 length:2730 start_codon:yes stop_codon:yes gene_type:complete
MAIRTLSNQTIDSTLSTTGAITSGGNLRVSSGILYVGNGSNTTARIMGFGDHEMITGVSGATYLRVSGSSTLAGTLQSGQYILAAGLAYGVVNSFTQIIDGSTGAITGTTADFTGNVVAGGNLTVTGNITGSSGTGHFSLVNASAYQLNGTYVMDSSRNLVNIGSGNFSGGITVTGGTTGADIYINNTSPTLGFTDSNSFSDPNDIYIIRGTSNDSLEFKWYDDSAGTTERTFIIDSIGNATFEGNGSFDTILNVTAPDNGGSPAMTSRINLHGYDGRGVGIKIKDNVTTSGGSTDREWFVGSGYNQSGFNIGYAADGSQSSYAAQTKLQITTGGYVGIQTTSPTAPLDVFGVRAGRNWALSGRADIRLDSTSNSYPADILFGHTAAANETSWQGVYWALSSRATDADNKFYFYRGAGNPTGGSEQVLMTLDPNLRVGIGTTSPSHKLDVTGTIRSNANEGKLILNSTATNGNEYQFISIDTGNLGIYDGTAYRLWIADSGNIGIGATSPGEKLEVNGVIQIKRVGDHPAIRFVENTTTRGYIGTGDWAINGLADADLGISSASTGSLVLGTNSGSGRVYIVNGGNVGIGTSSPSYNLEIGGTANPKIAIVSNINSATSSLYFGDSDAKNRGQVQYTHFGDFMELKAGGATRVYIESGINTAYTADGLFNANATPSYWLHNNARFTIGYMDNGSGLYSGAYAFNVKSTDGIPVTGREIGAIYLNDISNSRRPLRITNQGRITIQQTNTSTGLGTTTGWLNIVNGTSSYNIYNYYTGTDGASGCARYRVDNTSPSFFDFYYSTTQVGYITTNGSDIFYANTSDYRSKEDLKSFDGMSLLEQIQVYDFKWKESDNRMYGVVAHELQEVIPQAVVGDKDEEKLQAVDYSKLVPVLIKSIQELEARVKELENK